MPDMTLHSYAYCSEQEDFVYHIKDYIIKHGRSMNGMYVYDWNCTCKGFQFRHKCKHVEEAKKHMCTYDEFFCGDKPVNGKCPQCGKKTLTRLVAV